MLWRLARLALHVSRRFQAKEFNHDHATHELSWKGTCQAGFPGTAAGRVRPHSSWKPIEQATIGYGHGISTSLIQMAQWYLVFARDGEMIPITLMNTGAHPIAQPVISKKTAREVRTMMELAAGPQGTAPNFSCKLLSNAGVA